MEPTIRPAAAQDIPRIDFGEPGELEWQLGSDAYTALVAEQDGRIVGYATAQDSVVHRARRFLQMEVHPGHRDQGVGRALLTGLSAGDPRWFAVRTIAGSDACDFAIAMGGGVYQSCPPLLLDGRRLDSAATVLGDQDEFRVVPLANYAPLRIRAMWLEQYSWLHDAWSPVAETAEAREAVESESDEADRELSSVTLRNGRPIATCFVFADPGVPTLVAETLQRECEDGIDAVRAAIGRSLRHLRSQGHDHVEFDGHEADPHFGVVANTLPMTGDQVVLFEIPPVRG